MTEAAANAGEASGELACWCCGRPGRGDRMVRLGDHPEVALCLACARWAGKQAAAIEDQGRAGPMVTMRGWLRQARTAAIRRNWHRHPIFGPAVRWVGKRWP